MDDDSLSRLLLIIAVISLAMLFEYSLYSESLAESNAVLDSYSGNSLVKGHIKSIQEFNNSYLIELQTLNTLKILVMKNSFYDNISFGSDEIVVFSDFSDYYESLDEAYFAKRIVESKNINLSK